MFTTPANKGGGRMPAAASGLFRIPSIGFGFTAETHTVHGLVSLTPSAQSPTLAFRADGANSH